MCGIIGIASNKSVSSNIIQSLKKLEYRGYDSAGIATIVDGHIDEKNYIEKKSIDGNINYRIREIVRCNRLKEKVETILSSICELSINDKIPNSYKYYCLNDPFPKDYEYMCFFIFSDIL